MRVTRRVDRGRSRSAYAVGVLGYLQLGTSHFRKSYDQGRRFEECEIVSAPGDVDIGERHEVSYLSSSLPD